MILFNFKVMIVLKNKNELKEIQKLREKHIKYNNKKTK
jgi:hypothetical protein